MHHQVTRQSVPKPSSWCVVRPQEQQYLVYNTRTDELYLLSPTGFYIYQLCDGLSTVQDLENVLRELFDADAQTLSTQLSEFLLQLSQRGILEIEACHA